MRKKMMFVAVLLGGLSLGACVDNNESESVTDVRKAKTEQLKSVATLNQAEAQAKLIAANAEAALKMAQAEVEKANAAKIAADVEIAKKQAELIELQKEAAKLQNEAAIIENKKKQAALDEQLAKLDVTKKQAEADIAEIVKQMEITKADLDRQLLVLKNQIAKAQETLNATNDEIASNELKALKTLSNEYATALTTYTNHTQTLSGYKVELAKLEADLENWEALKADDIKANEEAITWCDAQIALLKKYTNYKTPEELAKLRKDLDSKNAQLDLAYDKANALRNQYNDVVVDKTTINEKTDAIYNTALMKFWNNRYDYNVNGENLGGKYYYIRFSNDWISNLSIYTDERLTIEKDDMTFNSINEWTKVLDITKSDATDAEMTYKEYIAALTKEIADIEKSINTAGTGLKAVFDAAKTACTTAETAYNAAKPGDAKYEELKQAYLNAKSAMENAERNYNNATASVTTYKEKQAKALKAYSVVTDAKLVTALEDAVKAYNDAILPAYTESANAYFAWQVAKAEADAINSEIAAIEAVLNARMNFDSTGTWFTQMQNFYGYINNSGYNDNLVREILANIYVYFYQSGTGMYGAVELESMIEQLEAEKVKMTEAIASLKDTTSQKDLIASKKLNIVKEEAMISALKAIMDQTKAKLDAAMAKYESAK